jgi:hypothetical protein
MKIREKNNNFYIFLFLISILLIILIVSFLYISNLKNKINKYLNFENFNNNIGLIFESGTSGISQTGTINFKNPFVNIPLVFTQINGTTNSSSNLFSVNIFNITNNSFSYAKNQAYNLNGVTEEASYSIPKIAPSTVETFNWIAIG